MLQFLWPLFGSGILSVHCYYLDKQLSQRQRFLFLCREPEFFEAGGMPVCRCKNKYPFDMVSSSPPLKKTRINNYPVHSIIRSIGWLTNDCRENLITAFNALLMHRGEDCIVYKMDSWCFWFQLLKNVSSPYGCSQVTATILEARRCQAGHGILFTTVHYDPQHFMNIETFSTILMGKENEQTRCFCEGNIIQQVKINRKSCYSSCIKNRNFTKHHRQIKNLILPAHMHND